MQIDQIKVKVLGQTGIIFRVLNEKREVLKGFSTKAEAEAWMASK